MPLRLNPVTGQLDLVMGPGSGTATVQVDTDSGSATPTATGVLNVVGGTGVTVSGASNTVTITSLNTGDVVGPASSTDNAIVRYDGTTGKLIQNSNVLLDDSDGITGASLLEVGNLQLNGNSLSSLDTDGNINLSPNGTGLVLSPNTLVLNSTSGESTITIGGVALDTALIVHSEGANDLAEITFERHTDTAAFGAHTVFARSRGTEGVETIVQSGDVLSQMVSVGHDGTDFEQAANIKVEVDGTPGAGDMPGRIVMMTSADGGASPIEALRIDNAQRVGIGTTSLIDTLNVTGTVCIQHTAAEDDDHALEIIVNAAGFSDVKAFDIDYITGAMAATDDQEVMLVNIDESASVGGQVAGYEVLSTNEGSANVTGYATGINIDPILHNSGTFGDIDNILNKALDVTAALASGGAGNISVFVADNDTVTYGDAAIWNEMEFILDTPASGSGIAPTFEYSTGGSGFSAFTPADGTNGLRNSGAVLWVAADLAGWATNTSGLFEIRHTRTRNNLNTTPILDEVQLSSATEFKWDKVGDVNVNSLTLVTDLAVTHGGTARSSHTAYAVICGGTTTTAAQQSIASVGTSGQILTSNGAAALPTFQAAAGGGAWTLLATTTASTSATVDFESLITSTYSIYKIYVDNIVPGTDADFLWFRTSTDNGVSYDEGVSDYMWLNFNADTSDSAPALKTDIADGKIVLGDTSSGYGSGTNETGSLEVTIYNPTAVKYTYITYVAAYENNSARVNYNTGMGRRDSAADVDAVRFIFETDTIASGTFKLYGIAAS